MAEIQLKKVAYFVVLQNGREIAMDTDRDRLAREMHVTPRSRRKQIVPVEAEAGEIFAEVLDWNQGIEPSQYKLHWHCPKCDYHQWGDLVPGTSSPCHWYSNCSCINTWLIHWFSIPQIDFRWRDADESD